MNLSACMMLSKSKIWLFIVLICQGPKASGNEIIHGEKVKNGTFLYMASVQINNTHECGGFLVSEDFVITAAHCPGNDVVLGTHNIENASPIMKYNVMKKYVHPDYTGVVNGNDIMLLKLSRKVTPSETLQPIQLPRKGSIINENSVCFMAGWGMTKSNSPTVYELLVTNVSLISRDDCQNQWNKHITLPPDIICAGGYNSKNGFCQGDSGGPLVCNGKVVGVASFNYDRNCNYPNYPNVYTSISNYLPWINEKINEE